MPGWTHGEESGVAKATLKKLFPGADSFVTKPLNLSAEQKRKIEARLGTKLEDHDLTAPAYVASTKGRSIGIVWATDAHLPQGAIDIIVGLDLKGNLTGVAVAHSPIAALGQSGYLSQYSKLNSHSQFKEGKDLKAIPGQSGSAVVAKAAQKAAIIIEETFLGAKK